MSIKLYHIQLRGIFLSGSLNQLTYYLIILNVYLFQRQITKLNNWNLYTAVQLDLRFILFSLSVCLLVFADKGKQFHLLHTFPKQNRSTETMIRYIFKVSRMVNIYYCCVCQNYTLSVCMCSEHFSTPVPK